MNPDLKQEIQFPTSYSGKKLHSTFVILICIAAVSTMSIISTHLLSAIQASAVTHSNIDDGFVSLQNCGESEQNSCSFYLYSSHGGQVPDTD